MSSIRRDTDKYWFEGVGYESLQELLEKVPDPYDENGRIWFDGASFDSKKELLNAYEGEDDVRALSMLFTTTPTIAGEEIEKALGMVSADCAYGMNVFRDIFASVRDFVGGRSKATEKVLRDAKGVVKQEMAKQAVEMGAEAIVGLTFDVTEMGGGLKVGMLLVSGTGTAVKFVRAADPASERGN